MNMLVAFSPFIAFALLDRLAGAREGLIAGAVVSVVLVARERIRGRSAKVLEVGSALVFVGLAIFTLVTNPEWSIVGVRLAVDAGLLVIVLVSLAIRRPFTLQYARERVPQEHWGSPTFVRTNSVITAAWALAFALLVVADLVMLYATEIPHQVGVFMTIAALAGAFKFTDWYPNCAGGSLPADAEPVVRDPAVGS